MAYGFLPLQLPQKQMSLAYDARFPFYESQGMGFGPAAPRSLCVLRAEPENGKNHGPEMLFLIKRICRDEKST